jgi:signal transduction histidine kinase
LPERAEEYSMATSRVTPRNRWSAYAVIAIFLVAYGAVAPFARTAVPRIDSFIPTMMAIVFVTDLVTAVLLFGQFSITGSRALLILASGYLFSSLIAIPFALTFPGAFAPTGLLGAGSQSAAWLNVFFRFGFSLAITGYAFLIPSKHTKGSIGLSPQPAIFRSAAIVIIVVCALTLAVTAGRDLMPLLLSDNNILPLGYDANGMIALTNVFALLLLWFRGKSALDLWVMVVVCALIMETSLVALGFVPSRFTVGFYSTRLLPFIVSKVVLIVLLSETLIHYRRLASAFTLLRRESENRLMSVDAAIGAIAHEVKQPLTGFSAGCLAALRWLKRTPPDCEKAIDCLMGAMKASDRANEILNSTRALFRITAHQKTMIEINRLAEQVLEMVENDLHVHGVSVSTKYQEDLPQIAADRTQLQQVILNLVKNAIEAMVVGPATIRTLRLVTTQDGNSVVSLSVQDSGPGISPENRTHIFDPFFTTKSSGMGLGLAVCKRIIEDHGGDLRLTKTSSDGCTFEITLPSVATRDSGGLRRAIAAAGVLVPQRLKAETLFDPNR